MRGLSIDLIREATRFLEGRVRRTPVELSPGLSELLGAPVWLKLECLQQTGSFKLRGALFRLSRLTQAERRAGVATSSAGNHGQGVAWAARQLGVKATVYVPRTIDESRHRRMVAMGAEVVRSPHAGYDETEAWARGEAAGAGKPFISPFDDWAVMAANGGSLAAEVLEDVPDARTFLLPVGGGGLAAGFSFYCCETLESPLLVGCQLESSPALALSFEREEAVTRLPAVETSATGLEGGLGRLTFEVLRARLSRNVVLLSETEILRALAWILDNHRYVVEPSGAVGVAAILSRKVETSRGPLVVVLSGGNAAVATVRRALDLYQS